MSTYINTEIKPFNATAYHNGRIRFRCLTLT